MSLTSMDRDPEYSSQQSADDLAYGQSERLEALRGLMLYGRLGTSQDDPLPDFPLELNHRPNIYYMYVGNAQ